MLESSNATESKRSRVFLSHRVRHLLKNKQSHVDFLTRSSSDTNKLTFHFARELVLTRWVAISIKITPAALRRITWSGLATRKYDLYPRISTTAHHAVYGTNLIACHNRQEHHFQQVRAQKSATCAAPA